MWKMARVGALLAILGIAVGCGDDDTVEPMTDAGPGGDAGPADSGALDGGMIGDGNDSFADADPITPGTTVNDAIREPGDEDYFSFTGTAGQWVWITTTANPDDTPGMVDTVITLYDASMTQIAENDDAQPRVNTDSEIITRLPAAGTYYVRVQEWSTWAGETPVGMPSFTYELDVAPIAAGGGINVDAEGGDDVASAQAMTFQAVTGGEVNVVLGTAEDGTDVDVYSFSVVAERPLARFVIMPEGTDGYGSTGQPAQLWVTNAAGDEVIARITTDQVTELEPSLPPGDYRLWVGSPAATGANAFYVVKGFLLGDNPAETAELTNGVPATPEAITFEAVPGDATTRVGFVLARLGDADLDHFSIEVMSGEAVNVFCGSRTSGSGVIGLEAAVLDSTGTTTLGTASETATDPIAIENLAVSGAGTYLLRLTKTGQDAEVTGDWVRCGIALAPPATP